MHTVISSCKKNKYRWGGWVGLRHVWTVPKKTSEEWRENQCDKGGWVSTQTSTLKRRKSATFCCVSPLLLRSASLSQREAGINNGNCKTEHRGSNA